MKEIKFRVWDKEREKMFCKENQSGIHSIEFNQFGEINVIEVFEFTQNGDFEFSVLNEDAAEIIQYTGVIDKNGVEIYKGDIVKGTTKHEFLDNIYFHKGIVDFKDGCFVTLGEDGNYHILSELSDLEVIGNIYENKE